MKISHQKVKDALQELIDVGGGYREFDFFDIYKIENDPRSLYNREDEEGFELRAAAGVGTFEIPVNKSVPANFGLHPYDFIPVRQSENSFWYTNSETYVIPLNIATTSYQGYVQTKLVHNANGNTHPFLPASAFTNYAAMYITKESIREQTIDWLARFLVYRAAEAASANIMHQVLNVSTPTAYTFFAPLVTTSPNYLDAIRALYLYGINVRNDYTKYFLLFCTHPVYFRIITEKDARQNRDLPFEDFIKILVAPARYSYPFTQDLGLFAVDGALVLNVSRTRLLLSNDSENRYRVVFEFYSELRRVESYYPSFDFAEVINFSFSALLSNLS
jgi:hypothetical protein